MGYTHYWTQTRDFTDAEWATVTEQFKKIIFEAHCDICGPMGEEDTKPRFDADVIAFNGRDECAHETFNIDRTIQGDGWSFCKTARKPYDTAVTACLTLLQTDYGFDVSSDGDVEDWDDGVFLAERAVDRQFANPLIVETMRA